MGLFHRLLRAPSWQSCSLLACGWALATARWPRWAQMLRQAASWGPHEEPRGLASEAFTKTKTGRQIAGLDCDRNRAGSARQEYRPRRGVHFVLGVLPLPLSC
jgi:hypothetical protein